MQYKITIVVECLEEEDANDLKRMALDGIILSNYEKIISSNLEKIEDSSKTPAL